MPPPCKRGRSLALVIGCQEARGSRGARPWKFFSDLFLGARSALRAGSEKVAQALKNPNRQPRSVIIPYPARRFKKMRISRQGDGRTRGASRSASEPRQTMAKCTLFLRVSSAPFPWEKSAVFSQGLLSDQRLPACEFFALLRRGSERGQAFFSHCAGWFVCEYLFAARFQIRHFLTEKPPLQ